MLCCLRVGNESLASWDPRASLVVVLQGKLGGVRLEHSDHVLTIFRHPRGFILDRLRLRRDFQVRALGLRGRKGVEVVILILVGERDLVWGGACRRLGVLLGILGSPGLLRRFPRALRLPVCRRCRSCCWDIEVLGRLSARGVPRVLRLPATSLLLPFGALTGREGAPLLVLSPSEVVRRRLLPTAVGLLASVGALRHRGTCGWLSRPERLLVVSGSGLVLGDAYELLGQRLCFIVLAVIELAWVLLRNVCDDVVVLGDPHL